MQAVLSGVLGAVFGSFLNVVAFRLPRRESLLAPRSRCPACATPVRPYDNIPILSYLLLRGRCRACGQRISPRYPLIEALCAALCVAIVLTRSSAAGIALGIALVLFVIPAAAIDVAHYIIPNRIVAPGALVALLLGSVLDPAGEPARLAAGAGAGAVLLGIALAYPRGMGMGDVKLIAMIGLYLGVNVLPAFFLALISGTMLGAVIIWRRGVATGRKTAIPFGLFLALGALLALFLGAPLIHWYTHDLVGSR
jgi:leader peptidase (prepilin peptidase)/N-methyltransferase